jgi:hypothetical protein
VTWTPGHDRKPVGASRFRGLARLRREREARARETAAAHALKGSLMSLAALLGSEVKATDGRSIGRLAISRSSARPSRRVSQQVIPDPRLVQICRLLRCELERRPTCDQERGAYARGVVDP